MGVRVGQISTCPSCSSSNPEGQRFCGACGASLEAPARPIAQERKVITALFCDLVGFTATAESADPEDVDRMLSAYAAMARAQIEAFGGVVEKFIGDAVVGIFGIPAAHEDDPERAVHAGLRIAEDAEELEAIGGAPLRLRVGISSGETLVRLGVTPGSGERLLAGDAINTASRIQSVAPEMGVAVGLTAYEATSSVFDYEELPPATLKGKTQPVRVFHAIAARAHLGTDLTRTYDTPFIGREVDLAILRGVFDKTVAGRSVQLVTVVGEPGLGKSRIVAELGAYLDRKPDVTVWRQGRCLPYGDGITYWALGEILKAHAGILESDATSVAQAKLERVLPEGDERAWFRQRLLPLLGIEASSSAEREELFTAWRRFLEHIADRGPAVLVFEDLHWADESMLAFLEHLIGHAEGVPLLVVVTTRPELFERYPDSTDGLPNTTRINLTPLSEDETGRLVAALLGTATVPAGLRRPILDRAGGNPLYAEEFVRLLRDRDLVVKSGAGWELRERAEVPFPHSVHALIAARLDTLPPETKAIIADAAVVGKVFWAGAVAQMGDRDVGGVTDALRELSRKELVRPARRSSIEGEIEYAFWHILARDVAYGQLPRASRASRHVAAARWIESKTPERVQDLADMLAYHYTTALELARASARTEHASELEAPALRFLSLAGERALGLDTATAISSLERALALAPQGHPERAEALSRFGEAAFQGGRLAEASDALEEAVALFTADGDLPAAARSMGTLGSVASRLGDRRWSELPSEALALLEPLGPSPELVGALTEVGRVEALLGRSAQAIALTERALGMAEELGLGCPARTLGFRGLARGDLGDSGGLADMREAIALATDAGQGREVALLHNNLGAALWVFEGPEASLEVMHAGIAFARTRGLAEMVDATMAGTLDELVDSGTLDEALDGAARLAQRLETEDVGVLTEVRALELRILTLRGQAERMSGSLDWLESASRETGAAEDALIGLGSSAFARAGLGQTDRAAALLTETEATPGVREALNYAAYLPAMVRTALALGESELAERLVGGLEPRHPYAEHALVAANAALAEHRGDIREAASGYAEAADRWKAFGVVPERGFALLGGGRCLLGLGRPAEAGDALRAAREIFDGLDAAPMRSETDALLAESSSLSP